MLKKLANGELSLKLTFWVFGLLGFFIFFIATYITRAGLAKYFSGSVISFVMSNFIKLLIAGTQSGVMFYLTAHVLLSASFAVYMYITLRGLWKSSENYEGKVFWPWMAKIILVCVAILSLISIF